MAKTDGRTLDHKALEHIRLLAVKRVVEDGEAPSEVIKSLGFSRTAIYPWLRKFEEEGWDGLVERIAEGREPKLSEKQRQQVSRWILEPVCKLRNSEGGTVFVPGCLRRWRDDQCTLYL